MRQCERCGKGSVVRGKRKLLRGHYNPVATSRKYPNLQWTTVKGKRMRVCTNCMRSIAKTPKAKTGRKSGGS